MPVIADSVLLVPEARSEDCLYLNVWTPKPDDKGRPVMVWIHGGGLENGSGGQPNYDGGALARAGDVVVVTLNMRLGPFGFLRLKDLTNGLIPSTGNEGRLDEIAALRWVRHNVARFGGDPANVTIFGQSAGAVDVASLLASPLTKGLLHRVILQSSAAHSAQSIDDANHVAETFLEAAEVHPDDVDGLLSLEPSALVRASHGCLGRLIQRGHGLMHFNPVVDGNLLERTPIDAVRAGAADGISVMAGTNLDDTRIGQGSPSPSSLDGPGAVAQLSRCLGDEAGGAIESYQRFLEARSAPVTSMDALLAVETDRVLRQPTIALLEALEARGHPGHHFIVTHRSPAYGGRLGACHAVELPLLFGTHHHPNLAPFSGAGSEEDRLSARLQAAWTRFAASGDPSTPHAAWPSYGTQRETMLIRAPAWELVEAPYEAERRFWAELDIDPRLGLM